MLALYCLYSGGVSGWVGGLETLYWRVETTVTGRERRTERGERGRGDADEGGQQTKENRKKEKNVRRMKSNQLSNQASKDEKIRSNPKTEANSK